MTRILGFSFLLVAVASVASAQTPGELDALQENAVKAAAQQIAPSIVQIETSGGSDVISFGQSPRGGAQVRKGTGPTTGVVVSPDGYVITSAFNFANKPTDIFVTVPGKKRYVAKVIATDTTRMVTLLQLLKIDANELQLAVPPAAPKKEMQIGQTAIALGRTLDPLIEHPPSISVGIVSALGRIWGKAIQTDAKVSPANYGGPLIDLQGRVLGILVPASPQGENETAGVEWYDGGIGFAIPFEDVLAVVPKLKQGNDLHKGVLGVNLQSQDPYGAEPIVRGVAPESTAAKAGIQAGDRILEINGQPISRQAQILHVLGPKYEGEIVTVKLKRSKDGKDEEIKLENLKLTAPLASYIAPFLGILPMRDDPELGVEVRWVYPKGPADAAGLKAGDRIMKVGLAQPEDKKAKPPMPTPMPAPMPPRQPMPPRIPSVNRGDMMPFSGRDELGALLAMLSSGAEIKLEVVRKENKKTETVVVKLGDLPTDVPDELPETSTVKKALTPRKSAMPMLPMQPMPPKKEEKKDGDKKDDKKDEPKEEKKKEAKKAETGFFKRSNAAADHQYWVYVPDDYDPNISYGLLLWLHPIGKSKDKDLEDMQSIWEDFCKSRHMIFAAPKAENDTGWLASETDVIQEVANNLKAEYTIDPHRVVVHGMGLGGQLAFYLGFHARDLIRGVATTGAVLTNAPKETVSNQPIAFFVVAGEKDPIAKAIADSITKLTEKKFPVVFHEIPDMGHQYLDAKTLEELVRWIDALDRL